MLDHEDVKMVMDLMFLLLFLLMRIDVNLEGHGGLVGGEEGVPVKLPLQLLAVLAVDKLEHRLVDHVRLRKNI